MLLSVVMPIYNCEEWLEYSLNSIPIREDVEVIMVENGSTDSSRKICEGYSKKNHNAILLNYTEPLGWCGALAKGVDIAKGEYIMQLDGDDYLFTNELNLLLSKDLGADLVYFDLIDNDNRRMELNDVSRNGLVDHTCLIKRSFLGDRRWKQETDINDCGAGYRLMHELFELNPTMRFTNRIVYKYNYPRINSLFWKVLHKEG